MKVYKKLGKFFMFLTSIIITVSTTSALTVGVEDMPESIKKLR
ncbi:hypothetical protein [Clostridium sp. 19966]|nr:hypothetical protein [Clostridium sp. 19966]